MCKKRSVTRAAFRDKIGTLTFRQCLGIPCSVQPDHFPNCLAANTPTQHSCNSFDSGSEYRILSLFKTQQSFTRWHIFTSADSVSILILCRHPFHPDSPLFTLFRPVCVSQQRYIPLLFSTTAAPPTTLGQATGKRCLTTLC
jgi:hypothetical protein